MTNGPENIDLTMMGFGAEHLVDHDETTTTLTCVYCGLAYPPGTPSHGVQVLTDHIKVCEKHPLHKAEATIKKLRAALVGLVGSDGEVDLNAMELTIRSIPMPEDDRLVTINAIDALRSTLPSIDNDGMDLAQIEAPLSDGGSFDLVYTKYTTLAAVDNFTAPMTSAGVYRMIQDFHSAHNADRAHDRQQIADLDFKLSDINDTYAKVITDMGADDERHCACVPHLRLRIEALQGELNVARVANESLHVRIDKLEKSDLIKIIERQIDFSVKTFGPPNNNTWGILDHICKEIDEVAASSGNAIEEWIDIVILALDGAWRAGFAADKIVDALIGKIELNEQRKWPDYRTAEPGKAIEHIKDEQS